MQEFGPILHAALAPIALISGVGLLLLSLVNRYNQAISRVRQLLKEESRSDEKTQRKLERSVAIIYQRCQLIRKAILCMASSIVATGALVLTTVLEGLFRFEWYFGKAMLLIVSVSLIVVAAVMFVVEVTYSLHALALELEK